MVTKNEKRSFAKRLNKALDAAGFVVKGEGRQLAVAKEFGVSQKGARKWLEGEAIPHTKRIREIATRLSVSGEWLLMGNESALLTAGVKSSDVAVGPDITPVPLISWVRAGQWSEAMDTYRVGEGEKPVWTTKKVSQRAFALRVVGDSMVNPHGFPTFPPGALIVIDPARHPENGSAVVARLENTKEVTFKQLQVHEGGKRWLKPLNPQYQSMQMDDSAVIIGVVVQTIIDNDTGYA